MDSRDFFISLAREDATVLDKLVSLTVTVNDPTGGNPTTHNGAAAGSAAHPEPDDNGPEDLLDEDADNDDMHQAGVSMGASGNTHFGAVHMGHVAMAPSGKGYRGYHKSGAKTRIAPTRAKAALHLLALHRRLQEK